MNDEQLLRYSRHLLLEDIGIEGQEKLLNAHALVIGAGGLGSAAAPYLAAAGVGHITLVDHDEVELTNGARVPRYATAKEAFDAGVSLARAIEVFLLPTVSMYLSSLVVFVILFSDS